jgi:hypothetical protein
MEMGKPVSDTIKWGGDATSRQDLASENLFDWRSNMNIKSLLLGSAAALAVVSGAQAADAVVAAEPEPMEYVKVCDEYGTGYFYIPGTETCLNIAGQFRYQKDWSKVGGAASSYDNWSRGRIEITAKNDSEWGTVSSWLRFQGSATDNKGTTFSTPTGTSTTSTNTDFYYTFGIGGLELGYYDSQFQDFFGYGGRTDDGDIYIGGPSLSEKGKYLGIANGEDGTRQYISYTASFDSITALLSLENDHSTTEVPGNSGNKYMPDVVGGVKGTFGSYVVMGGFAYDESDSSVVGTAKVTADIGMFGFSVQGFYSSSKFNDYFGYDGFSAIAGLSAKVTDSITLANDWQYFDNGDWRTVGDIKWQVATGFSVLLEGVYADMDDTKTKSGFLRFERSF